MNRKSIIGSRYEIIISLANAIYRNKWWIIIQHWNYSNFKTTAIKYSFCETIWLLLRKKKSKQKKEGETIERFKHEEHLKFHNSSKINTKFSQLLKTTVLNEKHIFFFFFLLLQIPSRNAKKTHDSNNRRHSAQLMAQHGHWKLTKYKIHYYIH